MAREVRFHQEIRRFSSRRDFPQRKSYLDYCRSDFRREESKPDCNLRFREDTVCRNFSYDSARVRYNGDIRVEKMSDFKNSQPRFNISVGGEKKSDQLSEIPKKARLCEIDEKLLPLKKRTRFNSESQLLPPSLLEVEEGEIVEECWINLPPLVVAQEKREILKESTAVKKVEATVQIRKPVVVPQILKESVKVEATVQIRKPVVPSIPKKIDPFQNINNLSEYELVRKINEGTFGVVHEAIHKKSGKVIALKQMKNGDGDSKLPGAAVVEIKLLFSLNHPSILKVTEVVKDETTGDFYLAMEFMEQDLYQFLKSRQQGLSTAEVKGLMLQLLDGVSFLHHGNILHRDLKTANLLLNKDGKLKICDFGLACREKKDGSPLPSLVVTLWYRAPELLLGTTHYSKEIDMWSVGCIMGELLKKDAIFKGNSDSHQLHCISEVLGSPTVKNSPVLSSLPGFSNVKFMHQPENLLRKKFPILSDHGLDLLKRLLSYDPKKRMTAETAKKHPWFREFPRPMPLKM